MEILKKYRFWIAGAIVVVIGAFLLTLAYDALKPLPDNTEFKSRYFSFTYPRTYNAEEYAAGVVSLGIPNDEGLNPLIEVTRYQSDPDTALPKDFDTFMKRQAGAICGADGPTESVSCTQVGAAAYTSPKGISGQKLDLTLVRKNLKTGTSTSSTYGPFYVFDTTASSTPDQPLRYSAIFVYPALPAFLDGTTTPMLMDQVISTFSLNK